MTRSAAARSGILRVALALLLPHMLLAQAQSPREQLQQLVAQLQVTPTDSILRARIIKLGAELKPPPAIPEDARGWFIRGNTAFGDAKAVDDYARAAAFYETASSIAPWWGDPYFNLAKALELRQDYVGAIRALRLFVLSAPPAEDARKAQDYVYVLIERQDRLPKAIAATPPAQTETVLDGNSRLRALVMQLQLRYINAPLAYERCVTPSGWCTEDDALESTNWQLRRGLGKLYRFVFELANCRQDEISMFYLAPDDARPVRLCGAVRGPSLSDVQWMTAQGDPRNPVTVKFLGPSSIETIECAQGNQRCIRQRWLFR